MNRAMSWLVVGAVLSIPGCHRYWDEADALRRELRCGLTPSDVQTLAVEHKPAGLLETIPSGHEPTHMVREDSTSFSFWFVDGRLQWFSEGRYFGTTGLRNSLRVNLCTGEKTGSPMIRVDGPAEWKGGEIYLDGRRLSRLSTGDRNVTASAAIGVPIMTFGQHELRIVRPGVAPVVRRFVYAPSTFWPEEAIAFQVDAGELRGGG